MFKKKVTVQDVINQSIAERDGFLKNFHEFVDKYDFIVLFQHTSPDGDCVGSSLALKEILKQQFPYKKIYATGSSCGLFSWMHMEFDVLPNNFDFTKSLAIVLDVGGSSRIQCFDEYFKKPDKKFGAVVKIDHHGCESDFSLDLSWDDPTYVAVGCQLFQIAEYYGWMITPKAATYIYLAITTDSGSFTFDSTLPRSLIIGAKAIRKGADKNFLLQHLQNRTWNDIKAQNYILENVQKDENFLWFHLTNDVYKKLNLTSKSNLVNTMSNIEKNKIWVLFADTDTEAISVDFRSVGVSVRDIAIKFGGGGHENASGCTIKDESMISSVLAEVKSSVKKYIELELMSVHDLNPTKYLNDQFDGTISVTSTEIDKVKKIKDESQKTISDLKETSKKIIENIENSEN